MKIYSDLRSTFRDGTFLLPVRQSATSWNQIEMQLFCYELTYSTVCIYFRQLAVLSADVVQQQCTVYRYMRHKKNPRHDGSNQPLSSQVKSSQVKSIQVKSSQVKSRHYIRCCTARSSLCRYCTALQLADFRWIIIKQRPMLYSAQ